MKNPIKKIGSGGGECMHLFNLGQTSDSSSKIEL